MATNYPDIVDQNKELSAKTTQKREIQDTIDNRYKEIVMSFYTTSFLKIMAVIYHVEVICIFMMVVR